jgi:hypothetical protein
LQAVAVEVALDAVLVLLAAVVHLALEKKVLLVIQ